MSLRPDFCAPRLADVPLTALGGARVLLLDADNTLAPWRGAVPDPAAARWVESAKAAGFRLCIASNSDAERLRPLEEALGIPAFPRAGKPLPSGLRRIAREMGAAPDACALIGDQLLTDVLAARLAGMRAVLLEPLDPSREFTGTRVNRVLERILLRIFRIR
ncbi:MAG TPA: YqeG family HAD IIIA-type phosphatase [Candidatus Spyradocola merdavium]|nr:YqeG family HAD IIIA-type phosphatase [Candidatus Spyradocola merdavium]